MNRTCFDKETLTRYVARELDSRTVRAIDNHIEECATCAEAVLTAPLPPGEPEGWRAARPRIEARVQSAIARRAPSPLGRLLWNPIAGYGVAAVLAAGAFGLPLLRPASRESPEPIRALRLDSERNSISRASISGRWIALQFLVPIKENHRYAALIDGPAGRRSIGDLGEHDSMGE